MTNVKNYIQKESELSTIRVRLPKEQKNAVLKKMKSDEIKSVNTLVLALFKRYLDEQ